MAGVFSLPRRAKDHRSILAAWRVDSVARFGADRVNTRKKDIARRLEPYAKSRRLLGEDRRGSGFSQGQIIADGDASAALVKAAEFCSNSARAKKNGRSEDGRASRT